MQDLFKNTQGSISHESLASRMRDYPYIVGSEVPVWIMLGDNYYTGHIDLLLFDSKSNTVYVCDYKPDMSVSDRGSYSFLNSMPQVAVYGLTLQKQGDLKVKSLIFNKDGAWEFDPDKVLDPINNFMIENKDEWSPPWEDFLLYL